MKNDLGQREALVLLFCAFPHLGPIHPFVGTSVHAELSCVSQNVRSPSHPSRGYGIGWPYGVQGGALFLLEVHREGGLIGSPPGVVIMWTLTGVNRWA